jgi:hypothetical protein
MTQEHPSSTLLYPLSLLVALGATAALLSSCNQAVGQTRSAGEILPAVDVKLATASAPPSSTS